jgi:hypothetical protein
MRGTAALSVVGALGTQLPCANRAAAATLATALGVRMPAAARIEVRHRSLQLFFVLLHGLRDDAPHDSTLLRASLSWQVRLVGLLDAWASGPNSDTRGVERRRVSLSYSPKMTGKGVAILPRQLQAGLLGND